MLSRSVLFFAIVCSAAASGCSELVGADFDDKRVSRNQPPKAEDAVLENVVEGTVGNTLQLVGSDPEQDPLEYYLASESRDRAIIDPETGIFSFKSAYGAWTPDVFEDSYRYGVRHQNRLAEADVTVQLLPAGPLQLVPAESAPPLFPSPEQIPRYYFGASVDFDGDRVIVGATYDGAYVLSREVNGTWAHQHKINPPDKDAVRRAFGFRAALDGDWALVSAYGTFYPEVSPPGKVYFYKWNGAKYVLKQTECGAWDYCDVVPPEETPDRFGWNVALSGSVAAVSAKDDSSQRVTDDPSKRVINAGAVYVYELEGERWKRVAKLTAGVEAAEKAFFGSHIALHGDTLVVGAEGATTSASKSGAVYIYEGHEWRDPPNPPELVPLVLRPLLNYAIGPVALSRDYLLIGAPGANDGEGVAFLYDRATWATPAELQQPDDQHDSAGTRFGLAVALDGDIAVVTRPGTETNDNGGAFMFRREIQQHGSNAVWPLRQRWIADNTNGAGWSVGVNGMAVLVGAPYALPQGGGQGALPHGEVHAFHVPLDARVLFSEALR